MAYFDDNEEELLSALEQVKSNKDYLKDCPYHYINNEDIIWQSVTYFGSSLQYASSELLGNKNFIRSLIDNFDGWLIKYASEEIRSDLEIAKFAISKNGRIENLSPTLFSNKEIVLLALESEQNVVSVLKCMDNKFFDDEEVLLKAFVQRPDSIYMNLDENFSSKVNDKHFLLKAISISPLLFNHASLNLRKDKEFIYNTLKIYDNPESLNIPLSVKKEIGKNPLKYLESYFLKEKISRSLSNDNIQNVKMKI